MLGPGRYVPSPQPPTITPLRALGIQVEKRITWLGNCQSTPLSSPSFSFLRWLNALSGRFHRHHPSLRQHRPVAIGLFGHLRLLGSPSVNLALHLISVLPHADVPGSAHRWSKQKTRTGYSRLLLDKRRRSSKLARNLVHFIHPSSASRHAVSETDHLIRPVLRHRLLSSSP